MTIEEKIQKEVEKRKTFAIISHPDAGKTTITERLLLLGGAIRLAGDVKGRKTRKYATSDWMEIEKKRGISITSSVLQFTYRNYCINILDTPGHQDFSEDTYRTLAAADCAVMVIDMAKGVEQQTIKLFQVCRRQGIPIFTFINKMDRHGKEPLDLLDEIEKVLSIESYPMNWPVYLHDSNYGLYDRFSQKVQVYQREQNIEIALNEESENSKTQRERFLPGKMYKILCDDLSLLDVAGDSFDRQKIDQGQLTPVFFGSAINGFGVQEFLEAFLQLAPSPSKRESNKGTVDPADQTFSGFVFKIQANMDPGHRDRVAFLRICSGKFERDLAAVHKRTGKKIRLSQPQQFLAQDRQITEEAYPGDIIGLYDPGTYQVGDTIAQDDQLEFPRLPRFSPEHFVRVTASDTRKYKQFHKGLWQLAEEGTIQLYHKPENNEIILGVVGKLQLDVFQSRMEAEYGVYVNLEPLPYQLARWVKGEVAEAGDYLVYDDYKNTIALFKNKFSLEWTQEKNPSIKLLPLEERPLG